MVASSVIRNTVQQSSVSQKHSSNEHLQIALQSCVVETAALDLRLEAQILVSVTCGLIDYALE